MPRLVIYLPPLLIAVVLGAIPFVLRSQGGCIPERLDVVLFGDVTYARYGWESGKHQAALEKSQLGPEFGQVRKSLYRDDPGCDYRLKDGDASFLEAGTALYEVQGYKPEFMLAAASGFPFARDRGIPEERAVPYIALIVRGAERGSDLFDFDGKVTYVRLRGRSGDFVEIARLEGAREIAVLVKAVLDAPVKNRPPGTGQSVVREEPVFIGFQLAHGIEVRRSYSLSTGELDPGIVLPQPARDIIYQALRSPVQ